MYNSFSVGTRFQVTSLCALDLCQTSKYNFIKGILRAPQNRTPPVNITLDKAKLKALRSYERIVLAARHQSHEKETEVWQSQTYDDLSRRIRQNNP